MFSTERSFFFFRSLAKKIFSFVKASAALTLSDIPWHGPIGEEHINLDLFTYLDLLTLNPLFGSSVQFKFFFISLYTFLKYNLGLLVCLCSYRCRACGVGRWRVSGQPHEGRDELQQS